MPESFITSGALFWSALLVVVSTEIVIHFRKGKK